ERLRALYRSAGDFQSVYGQPLTSLEKAWHEFLATQPLDSATRARAKERFRRGAIFQRVCARELAARVADARASLVADPTRAVHLLETICADDPDEPIHRLDLADALAAAGRYPPALDIATKAAQDERLTNPLRSRAANLTAIVHVAMGQLAQAEQ